MTVEREPGAPSNNLEHGSIEWPDVATNHILHHDDLDLLWVAGKPAGRVHNTHVMVQICCYRSDRIRKSFRVSFTVWARPDRGELNSVPRVQDPAARKLNASKK